jgi:hypothetical protein
LPLHENVPERVPLSPGNLTLDSGQVSEQEIAQDLGLWFSKHEVHESSSAVPQLLVDWITAASALVLPSAKDCRQEKKHKGQQCK